MSRRALVFYGVQGLEVQQLQRLLGLVPDGFFGPATQAAVVAFQQAHGLSPDGVVGADTWAALEGGLPETLTVASWGAARPAFLLRLPVGWQVVSKYGPRGNPPQPHHGVDLAGEGWAEEPPVLLAPATGQVTVNERDPWGGGYGFWVMVTSAESPEMAFFAAHLSQVAPGLQGASVREGQPLGRAGTTGRSYGVHFHIEVRHNGQHTDPAATLRVEDYLFGQVAA